MRFVKNPVEFEAVQWNGQNLKELREFCGTRKDDDGYDHQVFNPIGTYLLPDDEGFEPSQRGELWVAANKSVLPIDLGEWVVKDDLGFYPCKDEIMRKNNTEIDESVGLAEVTERVSEFERELEELVNRHSLENITGTPDFILAGFLKGALTAFETAVIHRAAWRGESVELPALINPDGKTVPLVMYTDGKRNEIGEAVIKVTPGEVLVSGNINGAVPMFGIDIHHGQFSIADTDPLGNGDKGRC